MDLYFFSYTGTCQSIAKELGSLLKSTPRAIKTYKLPYFLWLIFSFIPNLQVKISYEKPTSPYGVVIFPKWTFNCPPITTFLREVSFKKLLLVICYGGWREKPYGEYYKNLALRKSKEVKIYYIKRASWERNKAFELERLEETVLKTFGEEG